MTNRYAKPALVRRWAALLALLVATATAVPAAPAVAAPADTDPLSPAAVERLAGLARLWGKVKYFHPYLGYREIDWDRALVETLPRVEAAESAAEYRAAVDHLLSYLDDPATRAVAPEPEGEPGDEVADLGTAGLPPIRLATAGLAAAEEGGESDPQAPAEPALPAVEWLPGRIAWVDARAYGDMLSARTMGEGFFAPAFREARDGEGIVLDLRGPVDGAGPYATYLLRQNLLSDLPLLLTEELLLPASRQRMHSGYAPQDGGAAGLYLSGFVVTEHERLAAGGEAARPVPLVILSNDGLGLVWELLAGLQAAGVATLVHQGELNPFDAGGAEVVLPDGVVVRMRAAETILPDGSLGLEPDLLLPPPAEETEGADPARERALAILANGGELERRPPSPPPPPRKLVEDPYPEMAYPTRPYRLLALFRFWNVIEYFFPYRELMDRPWEEALTDLLPRFAEAEDELAYTLAVAELVARIQDSHGFLGSQVFNRWVGTHGPPLDLRFIEDRLVVTAVLDEELERSGAVAVGDVVLAVDGEEIATREARLAPYVAASTPQALRWRLARMLLGGEEGSEARLLLDRGEGEPREVAVPRGGVDRAAARQRLEENKLPLFTVLPEGYGYMDLTRLERAQVPEAMEAVRETPALILDLRGYPRGTAWTLTPYLAAESAVAARFRRKAYVDAYDFGNSDYTFEQRFPAGGPWQYPGRLVVLMDERAISQAEHSCLFFESARPDVTFIGSPTNGANGDVTTTVLPGGISVTFSGHDVRHADGRQLQRVGIQPHLPVAPTLAGVRAGRDEVLEAALAHLAGLTESEAPEGPDAPDGGS